MSKAIGYHFTLKGVQVCALPEALLWLPDSRTLVASDLHFEKGSAFAAKGVLLPPFDTAETLNRLEGAIARYRPERLICLGDSFHDVLADGRLGDEDRARLSALSRAIDTIWIEGNHDPEVPTWLNGLRCETFEVEGLLFRHEPTSQNAGEISGHLHPCARVVGKSGRSIRRRCFVTDGRILIMPAFGAFTGGLNVMDPAYDGLFSPAKTVLVPSGQTVQAIGCERLSVSG